MQVNAVKDDTCKCTHGPTCIFFAKNTVYFQFEYFYCELTIRIYLKNPDFTKNCREKNRQIQIL